MRFTHFFGRLAFQLEKMPRAEVGIEPPLAIAIVWNAQKTCVIWQESAHR